MMVLDKGSVRMYCHDVEALTLALDIGDISDMDTDINARQKLLDELFADFPGMPDRIGETNRHALARLQEVKATLELVRMWVCAGNPAKQCGLFFVCRLLLDARTPLSVVRVPEQIEKDNGIGEIKMPQPPVIQLPQDNTIVSLYSR